MSRPLVIIEWAETARLALAQIGSRTLRQKVFDKVDRLKSEAEPESLGKPLQDELQGMYRLTHGRYRIIYKVDRQKHRGAQQVRIGVALVGIRKEGDKRDIYRLAAKLRSQGKL